MLAQILRAGQVVSYLQKRSQDLAFIQKSTPTSRNLLRVRDLTHRCKCQTGKQYVMSSIPRTKEKNRKKKMKEREKKKTFQHNPEKFPKK